MKKQIYTNFERCIHCRACEVACQREKQGLNLVSVMLVADRFAVPLTCRHCNPAPCAMVCPTKALSLNGAEVLLDTNKCTGCTLCLYACPFGMMNFNTKSKVAANCDVCESRRNNGLDPACILTCPSSALHYGDYASYMNKERRRISAEIMRAQPLKRGEI
jgi:formate dehydrogenase iron-sulfur subunit